MKKAGTQFEKILQIGIIVRNVENAVKTYEEKYGFGPWKVDTMSTKIPVFQDMTINGEKTYFEIKAAICNCFGMQFELIEPVSDSPLKTWLEKHGPGIHHLTFLTRDEYEKLLKDHKSQTGKNPMLRGECSTIGMDFSYLDFTEELGFIADVHGGNENSGELGHMF